MRLVYQNARDVIIWFGTSSDHIDSLFDWMNRLDRHILNIPRPHTMSAWKNGWDWIVWDSDKECPTVEITHAFIQLLKRQWFSRIWVLQEAAAARSATIACGRNRVHSRTFVLMPLVLNVKCGEGEQARLDLMPGLLRDTWGLVKRLDRAQSEPSPNSGCYDRDLGMLLRKFGRSKASDPRDIIYALIGLSEDAYTSDILRPNYEISLQQVIQNTVGYLLTRSGDLHKGSYTGVLPAWDLEKFLWALHDLPMETFLWAMQHCEDELLADLLDCQVEKQDDLTIRKFITYLSTQGPLVTVSIKKANLELFKKCLQFPEADIRSEDKDAYTPLLTAKKQRNPIFEQLLLQALGNEGDEESWKRASTVLLDMLKLGTWTITILILGSLGAARYLGRTMWLMWWSRRVKRRWT